ncbi:sensor histidine kinase [Bacillus lacus]|uniref:Sensor histidine kinase n=1 Tax=Metabacillus lacus TaxID=1983721 RepID=A0A7X2LW77_9BACI|nr:sensor histidine kinase [Metabacillus lacus]MRX71180.1 sensor histidine kinase [Metabacillus lacus]
MKTILRQVLLHVLLSLGIAAVLSSAFLWVFPSVTLSSLWEAEVYDMPFIVFIGCLSSAAGFFTGIFTGMHWRNQFQSLSGELFHIEQGKPVQEEKLASLPERDMIAGSLLKIQKQQAEQAKLFQKMATEKATNQEVRIQEIVEQERNRLARELHDSVSQQLFAASMMMSAVTEGRAEGRQDDRQLKMVESMIHQSQLEMRALLLHLRPVPLKGKTLQEGMKELLIELTQKVPLEIEWKVEDMELDKGVEDHLFRILQESVSNTLRHAKATKLEVLLIHRDGLIIMRVVDNGIGFNVEETKAGSYGLQNMYERAVEIGGTTKIVSLKDKGTRLEVKVPIIL